MAGIIKLRWFILLSVAGHLLLLLVLPAAGHLHQRPRGNPPGLTISLLAMATPAPVVQPARRQAPLRPTPQVRSARPPLAGGSIPARQRAQQPPAREASQPLFITRQSIQSAVDAVLAEQQRGRPPALPPGLAPPAKPAATSALQRSLEANAPPDCRHAYAGFGLLAVLPLVHDAVTGRGCSWGERMTH